MRPWLKYTLVRIGIFAIALAVLLVFKVNPFLSAVIAAVASFALAYIFFRGLRDEMARDFAARNEKPEPVKNADTVAEDEALDRLE